MVNLSDFTIFIFFINNSDWRFPARAHYMFDPKCKVLAIPRKAKQNNNNKKLDHKEL
jgi:hypothetical protein